MERGLEIARRSLWVECDSFQMKLETQGRTMSCGAICGLVKTLGFHLIAMGAHRMVVGREGHEGGHAEAQMKGDGGSG